MYSGWTVTVPANTSANDSHREILHLTWGFIDYFAFWMYPESVGLTHFVVNHLSRQLYPFDVDEDFSIPGQLMQYHPKTSLKKLPYDLEVVAWNEDVSYEHSIHIFIGVQQKELIETIERMMEVPF